MISYNFRQELRRPVCVRFFRTLEEGSIPDNAAAIVDFRRKMRQCEYAAEIELVVCR